MNKLLQLTGTGFQISTTADAAALKKKLLADSSKIKAVTDNTSVALARFHRDRLHDTLKEVEEMRTEIKKPVLESGRQIDACAKTYSTELLVEKARIEKLMGVYAQEEARKRQLAEAEALRLKMEAERKLQEAERQRQKALDDLEAAKNKAQRKAAMEQIAKTEVQVEKASQSTETVETLMAVAQSEGPKGVKSDVDFETVSIHDLYAYDKFLVELTPRRQEILRILRLQQKEGKPVGLPGLKIVSVTKVR